MMSEDELQQLIRIECAKVGVTTMRNNSGVLMDRTGRPVRYGLCNESRVQNEQIKSSDLIAIKPVLITQEMVGMKLGVFTALEVKEPNWKANKKLNSHEIAQLRFIEFVRAQGGIAGFVNSIDSALELLK